MTKAVHGFGAEEQIKENEAAFRAILAKAPICMSPLEGTYLLWVDLRAWDGKEELERMVKEAYLFPTSGICLAKKAWAYPHQSGSTQASDRRSGRTAGRSDR